VQTLPGLAEALIIPRQPAEPRHAAERAFHEPAPGLVLDAHRREGSYGEVVSTGRPPILCENTNGTTYIHVTLGGCDVVLEDRSQA
jgi:hypothetical protein